MNFTDILMVAATQGGGASPPFVANAVDYNGTNQYLERLSAFTGIADSFTGIFSAWVRFDGGDGDGQRFLVDGLNGTYFGRTGANVIEVRLSTNPSSFIFDTVSTFTAGATWYSILASWNTNFSAGNKVGHLYINDVSDYAVAFDGGVAKEVDYSATSWGVAARPTTHNQNFNGCLSELYFAPGQFLDFSDSANRRKFIGAGGKPVNLGADGSTPTGTAPILYLKNPAASVGTNSGTGGDMTPAGTPTVCSTSPS